MPADMKNIIAEAARRLVVEKKVKKLTVKDIVEECGITRQTFYYHFDDIPDLFRWILKRGSEQLLQECVEQNNSEKMLRYLFLILINARPFMHQGMSSGYGEELEQIARETFYGFVEQAALEGGLYRDYSSRDARLLIRYHSGAVFELMRNWTDKDTEELDDIVHVIYRLLQGELPSVRINKEL